MLLIWIAIENKKPFPIDTYFRFVQNKKERDETQKQGKSTFGLFTAWDRL